MTCMSHPNSLCALFPFCVSYTDPSRQPIEVDFLALLASSEAVDDMDASDDDDCEEECVPPTSAVDTASSGSHVGAAAPSLPDVCETNSEMTPPDRVIMSARCKRGGLAAGVFTPIPW
jgi:hypothetical protein